MSTQRKSLAEAKEQMMNPGERAIHKRGGLGSSNKGGGGKEIRTPIEN